MNENKKKLSGVQLIAWIRENWTWAAPLVYIYITVMGFAQSWATFNAFGINIFEFSELNDFLLAAFRDPGTSLFVLGIITVYGFMIINWTRMMLHIESREQFLIMRFAKKFFKMLKPGIIAVIILAPISGPALLNDGYGADWKEQFMNDDYRHVRLLMKGVEENGETNRWIHNLILLGTTDSFVFFIEKEHYNVLIAPKNNISLIRRVTPHAERQMLYEKNTPK